MSKRIPLTQGKFAIVDDEDYEWLNQWKWHYNSWGPGYAMRHRGQLMHRTILDTPPGMETDHINHDGLDNRRANLRTCSRTENNANRRKYRNNTSGYIGVYWEKRRSRWRAQIYNECNKTWLGDFDGAKEAARAYDKAALELHGKFATLNFPSEAGA